MAHVTVALPVYNGEAYLDLAIRSVLEQPETDLLLHISDNASTDSTEAICRAWAAEDPRIRYDRLPTNIGMIPNFRRLAEAASTPYFSWLSSDDRMLPGFLDACVSALEADPGAVLAMTGLADVNLDDPRTEPVVVPEHLSTDDPDPVVRFRGLMGTHESLAQFGVYRTATLQSIRPYSWILEGDRVVLAEMALRGRFCRIPDVLYQRGQHPARSMRIQRATQRLAVMYPDRAGHIPFPTWALGYELARAVHESPLTASQRAACYASMRLWLRAHAPNLARNLARGAIEYSRRLSRPDAGRLGRSHGMTTASA